VEIGLANSFEPEGLMRCIEADEREGLAAVQLVEVVQLHSERVDYRSHAILKTVQPAETGKGFWVLSHRLICRFQITGFEKPALLALQEMGDCVMNWEPIHPARQGAGTDPSFKNGTVDRVGAFLKHVGKQKNRRYLPAPTKQGGDLLCRPSELGDTDKWQVIS